MINKHGLLFKFYAPISKIGIEKVNGIPKFFLEGYAATSDLDRQDEIIDIAALKQGATDLLINHAVFYEHRSDQHPIGKIIKTEVIEGTDNESDKLYIKIYISETATTIRTLIKEGILDKFSIGGKVLEAEPEFNKEAGKEILRIFKMELYEVSVVGLPANVKAESIGYEIHKSFKDEKISQVIDGIPVYKNKEVTNVENEKEVKKIETQEKEPKVEKTEDSKVEKTEKKETVKKEVKAEKPEAEKPEAKKAEKPEAEKPEAEKPEAKKPEGEKAEDYEYYDIADILETLKTITSGITEVLSILKIKTDEKKDKPVESTEADIEAAVEKAVEERLKNVRVIPTRKGLIIRDNREEKLTEKDDNATPLEILSDEESFDKLDNKDKKDIIRGGLLQILKNTNVLNEMANND